MPSASSLVTFANSVDPDQTTQQVKNAELFVKLENKTNLTPLKSKIDLSKGFCCILANSVDTDLPRNTASDQVQHCLSK